ncbi:MAG: type 1 glutamine amidotransferase domain-containing protein [Rickettsiales bacterium]
MASQHILLVLTSADRMGTKPEPTGAWLEEAVAPYYAFVDAKYDVTVASPLGGAVPMDPTSLQPENLTASTRRFEADAKAQHALAHSVKLSSVVLDEYAAIFFPGGHGTMEDFPIDASVRAAVEHFFVAGKPVASVCHGPAALVAATNGRGEPLVKAHRFTCFSDEEEALVGLADKVPFLLQSKLTSLGGRASIAPAFSPHVMVDRNLITGQNPASSIPAAEAVIHALRARQSRAA